MSLTLVGEIQMYLYIRMLSHRGRFGDGYIQCMWEVGAACLPNTCLCCGSHRSLSATDRLLSVDKA